MISPSQKSARPSNASLYIIALFAAFVAVALGFYARLYALGSRQLTVDEYYFITSVKAILQHGIPELPGGGYYTRGILLQYITAGCILLFGDNGVAYRLPSVIFSFGSVLLVYWYAAGRVGRSLAATLSALVLLSSWEVEFGRFARMYSMFQFVSIGYLIALSRYGDRTLGLARYLPHLLAVCAVLTHQLGILLIPFLFIPTMSAIASLDYQKLRALVSQTVVSLVLAIASLTWQFADLRNAGVTDPYPRDFVPHSTQLLRTPAFPFWNFGSDSQISLGVFLGVICSIVLLLSLLRLRLPKLKVSHIVAACMVISAIAHNFVLTIGFAGILVLRYGKPYRNLGRVEKQALIMAAVLTASWLLWAVSSQSWRDALPPNVGSFVGALRITFLGWPDFYTPILTPWLLEFPGITMVGFIAVIYQLLRIVRSPVDEIASHPTFIIAVVCCAVGALHSQYVSTRYLFFLYPLLLCTIALTLQDVAFAVAGRLKRTRAHRVDLIVSSVCVLAFGLSRDFNIKHLLTVDSEDVRFRTGAYASFARTWYGRWDFESPARFVDRNVRPAADDRIIVVGLGVVQYYLNADCALYLDRGDSRFAIVSRQLGTKDLWSGERLLSTERDLLHYTQGTGRVWLVRSVASSQVDVSSVWNNRLESSEIVYTSRDSRIEVLRIDLLLNNG